MWSLQRPCGLLLSALYNDHWFPAKKWSQREKLISEIICRTQRQRLCMYEGLTAHPQSCWAPISLIIKSIQVSSSSNLTKRHTCFRMPELISTSNITPSTRQSIVNFNSDFMSERRSRTELFHWLLHKNTQLWLYSLTNWPRKPDLFLGGPKLNHKGRPRAKRKQLSYDIKLKL